jgi:hypothetical protein
MAMAQELDATYPTVARWVMERGWIEIGQDDMSRSFIRALDDGGLVWEGRAHYPTLDAALQDLETGLAAWMHEQGL